ncbi:MAG TPA: zinc-ribbon domain containing protein [Pirellulales bacterium]
MAKQRRRVPRYLREEAAARGNAGSHPMGIPRDAIPANLNAQAPNNSYGPPLYYRDRPFQCVDCGVTQVWTAKQQQWWYEVAKGPIYSLAKRCRACRAALRAAHRGTPRKSHAERRREAAA